MGMKRSRPEEKGTLHLQPTLKKKEMRKPSLGKGTDTGASDTKEEDIVSEFEPAAF